MKLPGDVGVDRDAEAVCGDVTWSSRQPSWGPARQWPGPRRGLLPRTRAASSGPWQQEDGAAGTRQARRAHAQAAAAPDLVAAPGHAPEALTCALPRRAGIRGAAQTGSTALAA